MNKTDAPSLNHSQESSLRRYAGLGLGAAVLTGMVTTTDAAVVYTNYNSLLLKDTNTTDTTSTSYSIDVNGDGINDITFITRNEGSTSTSNYARVAGGINGNSVQALNVVGISATSSGYTFTYPSRLTTGTVSAARTFKTLALTANGVYLQVGSLAFGNGFTNSKWTTNATKSGYLGFSFTYGGALHYGFVAMTVGQQGLGTNSRAISIGGIAYETTANTAITLTNMYGFGSVPNSAVPEPSSIAMLALGAGGLAAYRQRRKKAAAAKAETV